LAKLAKQIDGVNADFDSFQLKQRKMLEFAADKLESAALTMKWTAEAMLESSQGRLSGLVDGSLSAAGSIIDSIEPVVWSLADDSITLSRGLIDSAAGQLKAQVEHLLEEVR
jgi:hypothetical protein